MRFSQFTVIAAFSASLGLARSAAAADVCVEVDTQRDNLSQQDRAAAQTMLEQALQDNGQRVVRQGCSVTYRVYNVQLGQSVTAVLTGPNGTRTLKVGKIEEIPEAYSQMVRSLLSGQPMTAESATMTRQNVTNQQAAPNRAAADKVWFLRLGYAGSRTDGSITTGPAFGFGLRYELDRIGIEPSFLNFALMKGDSGSYDGFTAEYVRLRALYYFDPISNGTLYAGAGVAWGAGSLPTGTDLTGEVLRYTGTGLNVNAAIGYEMLRASTIRLFAEADGTVPLYTLSSNGHTLWVPTVTLSVGLGWGGHPTVVVKTVD